MTAYLPAQAGQHGQQDDRDPDLAGDQYESAHVAAPLRQPAGHHREARPPSYRRYMCKRMVVPSSVDQISARSHTWLTSHSP